MDGSRELQRTCAENDYQPHSGSEVDGRATIRLPCNRRAGLFFGPWRRREKGHRHSVLASLLLSLEMPFAPITYRVENCHLLSRQIKIERSSHIGPGIALVR